MKLDFSKNLEFNRLAMEEIKILQNIIARHEGYSFKIRGWLLLIESAFLGAKASGTLDLSLPAHLYWGGAAIILCLILELIQREPKRKAIQRVDSIEKAIREEGNYDGCKIVQTFREGGYDWKKELKIRLFWVFYLATSIVVSLGISIVHRYSG